jgi:hypothetical protein
MKDVFLSYSRRNEEIMQRIRGDLEGEGISVWTDRTGIKRGSPKWQETIEEAIENVHSLVVVLSPAAKQSKWVGREIGYAEAFDKPIYPVLAQGNQKSAVPISLINTDWVDIRRQYSRGIAELIKALNRGLGRSDSTFIPATSRESDRQRKIEEIIQVMGGPLASGVIKVGKVTLHYGLNAYQKDTGVGYRATLSPLTDPDILEASRNLELRGWKIGPLNRPHYGKLVKLKFLPSNRPPAFDKAYEYTWLREFDETKVRKRVAQEIIAVNELIGIWPEDIKVEDLTVNPGRSDFA